MAEKIKVWWKSLSRRLKLAFIAVISCILALASILSNVPILTPPTPPTGDVTELYVDGFDDSKTGWNRYGSSPYLDDDDAPTNLVNTTDNLVDIGDFSFANLPSDATSISQSKLWVRVKCQYAFAKVEWYIWNTTNWICLGAPSCPTTWDWLSFNVTDYFDTIQEINGAKLYFKSSNFPYWQQVDAAFIRVWYEAQPNDPPTYTSYGTNTTAINETCLFYVNCKDDIGLSGWIFGWNGTGQWQNDTWQGWSNSPTQAQANATKSLYGVENNTVIQWQFWFNDTNNQWNTTGLQSFTATDTPPLITVYVAGNPNEKWTWAQVSDKWYLHPVKAYRNSTLQSENWMYINASIYDNCEISEVKFEWWNETGKYNLTMNQQGQFYYINMTNQPKYPYYSFNIYAKDNVGQWTVYKWLFRDYIKDREVNNQVWGEEEDWRKYVGLGYGNEDEYNFTYSIWFFYDYTYTENQCIERCLPHEQATDGSTHDTGVMYNKANSNESWERWCSIYIIFYLDENMVIHNNATIENMYLHLWLTDSMPSSDKKIGYKIERTGAPSFFEFEEYYIWNNASAEAVGDFSDKNFKYDTYYLEAKFWDVSDFNLSDNTANLLDFKFVGSNISLVSCGDEYNSSFVIFNLPDNSTLQNMDSDGDGISDYDELFVNYTCPFPSIVDELSVGWNQVVAQSIDVGKTLSQVNASLHLDNINFTVITFQYPNGTQISLYWNQATNEYWVENTTMTATADTTIWIYCKEAGEWTHNYGS